MKFDDIVIGFGKGGKTLAAELAKRGFKTAMVERSEKMYGGTCINIGCIPTKTLVHQAKMAACGTNKNFEAKSAYYREAIAEKDRVTSALRQKNYGNLANNDLVTVFTGEGTFTSANTVSVSRDRETVELQAPQIFINTGSETIIPAIDGIQNNPFVYTSTSLMNLKELPKRLVIIGGGYIGLEYASMYASFGSEVTILESGNSFIPREDRDVADAVKKRLEKMGVRVFLNTKVQSVFEKEKNAVVSYLDLKTSSEEHLEAEAVLLATGRKPATASLHLAAAGIETDERGAIKVDEHLVTTNPAVRAMGDVKGGPQFTYISLDDFRIVRDDLFGEKHRNLNDRGDVVYAVFIDPPLARIGMNEDEAQRSEKNYMVKKLSVAAIPRAKTLGETDGILKAIVEVETQKILGCTLFCPEAGEMINTVAFAVKNNMPATSLRDFIFTHPSMSESLNDLFA